jgi:hexosaminidase
MFLHQLPVNSPAIALIPQPSQVFQNPGSFVINRNTHISAPRDCASLSERLAEYLRPATGFAIPTSGRGGSDAITLHLDSKWADLGGEGYRLQVKKDRVDIYAAAQAGLFYGFQTFRELLPSDIFRSAPIPGEQWAAQCVYIYDIPRFAWRGAHMDVSRHFEQKGFVEKFLDEMALHKLNVFHWHLTDDPGWRIEIKKYPKLTAGGSPTDYSLMNPDEKTRSRSELPGGYYTQADIKEVVAYAAARYITILPEIEMPGHSAAAVSAYPELGNFGEITTAGGDVSKMGRDNEYNVDDSTIQFLKDVLDEVMVLFPSKFIHVGGDEVDKNPWKSNPKAQDRMKSLGIQTEDQLQSWVISQMDTYLTSKGRRLIGWDEILEGGLAPGAAVMSWRGVEGGITAAKSNHDVVMAPGDWTYLDHYQSKDQSKEPIAIGGYLPLRTVYEYEPIAPELTPDQAKHVLGLQGQLWSEFIPGTKHMEYMAFPRLCALAEVGWSNPKGRNYAEFLTRLQPHLARLKSLDVAFRDLTPEDLTPLSP